MGANIHIFKRAVLISLIVAFAVPQIAFAVWWNPFSWKIFQRTPVTQPHAQITETSDQSAEISRLQKEVAELKRPATGTPPKISVPHTPIRTQVSSQSSQKTATSSIADAQALGKQLANDLKMLTDLDERIERLEKIRAEAQASEKRYADYAETSTNQRVVSLEALSNNVGNPNTKQFIVSIVESGRKNAVGLRENYHELYFPIYEAINLWDNKISIARGDVNQGVPPSNLSEILTKDNYEQGRFISLIQFANKIVHDLELKKADNFTRDLNSIRNLLLIDETSASVNLQLGAIEQRANNASVPSTEIHCWATTQYSGSLLNGKSDTSIRCE